MIYILIEEQGSYSDYRMNLIRAYHSEDEAKKEAQRLNDLIKLRAETHHKIYNELYTEPRRIFDQTHKPDPKYASTYLDKEYMKIFNEFNKKQHQIMEEEWAKAGLESPIVLTDSEYSVQVLEVK